jgi:hypothetical protein
MQYISGLFINRQYHWLENQRPVFCVTGFPGFHRCANHLIRPLLLFRATVVDLQNGHSYTISR